MKDSFDVNSVLYGLLKGSAVSGAINGGIYIDDDRPDDSDAEDVVVNNINVSQDCSPQTGVSNVNVYVKDEVVTIGGKKQHKANRKRLDELTKVVLDVLRDARIDGFWFVIGNQSTLAEVSVRQHFTNIRVEWVIG